MFVKPAPGLKIRDPKSKKHLPESGSDVPDNSSFYLRRLACGDVLLINPIPDSAEK